MTELHSLLSASGWRLDTSDRSPILELDAYGEIVAIDTERYVVMLRVQIRSGPDHGSARPRTGQDGVTNGVADVMGSGTQIF
jgi:hypothetical protein